MSLPLLRQGREREAQDIGAYDTINSRNPKAIKGAKESEKASKTRCSCVNIVFY